MVLSRKNSNVSNTGMSILNKLSKGKDITSGGSNKISSLNPEQVQKIMIDKILPLLESYVKKSDINDMSVNVDQALASATILK